LKFPVYLLTMFNFIKLERAKKSVFERGDSRVMEGHRIRVRSDLICQTKKDLQHATHPYGMGGGKFSQGKDQSSRQKELFKIEKTEFCEADSKDNMKVFMQDFQFLTPKCEILHEVKNRSEWIKNEKVCQSSSTTLLPKSEKSGNFKADSKDGFLNNSLSPDLSSSSRQELFKIEKRENFETDSEDGIMKTSRLDYKFLIPKCENVEEVKYRPEWIKNEKTVQNFSSTTFLSKSENSEYGKFDSKHSLMNTSTKFLSPLLTINLISELLSRMEGISCNMNGKYFCSLCNITFDKNAIESHSEGGKHVSELLRKKFRQSKQHKYNSVSDFIDSSTRGKHICSLCQSDLKGIRFNLHLLSEHHAESIIKKMKKDEKKLFDKIRTNMEQKRKQILKWRWGKI